MLIPRRQSDHSYTFESDVEISKKTTDLDIIQNTDWAHFPT